ncbi:MAG: hypothetical protein V3T23_04875 [Nitrososphaerales archaeon]
MAEDILGGDPSKTTTSALEELVGEGKKFADHDALAIGKKEADGFIETLKTEKAAVLEELEALKAKGATNTTVQDLIKEIRGQTNPEGGDGNQPLSDEDFQEKVLSILQGDKQSNTKDSNRAQGNALVLGRKGIDGNADAAKAYIAERATALGMTTGAMRELSESSPILFAKAMDIDPSTSPKGVTSLPNQINPSALPNTDAVLEVDGHKTKSYYDAKKKEDGRVKWINNSRMQTEMAKDMAALGDKFNQ